MKMKSILLGMSLALFLVACGPKDADIQKEIDAKLREMPGVHVDVQDGVATISGICKDDAYKQNIENTVKGTKGIKSVVNNCDIPAPDAAPAAAAVIISSDNTLDKSVGDLVKDYDGVSATVVGGVVTLSGEIKRNELQPLMQSLQELKPKKVENKLTIK